MGGTLTLMLLQQRGRLTGGEAREESRVTRVIGRSPGGMRVNDYSLMPIMTSVDLMIAVTASPCLRFKLSTEVRVIAETIS